MDKEKAIPKQRQAVHGMETGIAQRTESMEKPCLCGCGRMVPKIRNRNGIEKQFFNDKCRAEDDRQARRYGQFFVRGKLSEKEKTEFMRVLQRSAAGEIGVYDKPLREARKKRQEYIDLEAMTPQERLGALCRAAEKWGVLKEEGRIKN